MKMRDGSNIPGVTGQGAGAQTSSIVNEMSDDRFNDFQGKLGDRRRLCGNPCQSTHGEQPFDSG